MSMGIFENCTDRFGYIRTKEYQRDTGNPNVYSEVFVDLHPDFPRSEIKRMDERRLGLWTGKVLYRTPENSYGQNSHDEAFDFLKMLHRIGNTRVARQFLWSLIYHCGFLYNKPFKDCSWKERGDGWIGRFPQIWAMAYVAAFPLNLVRFFSASVLKVSAHFSKPDLQNASGLQLQSRICFATTQLGSSSPMRALLARLKAAQISLSEMMSTPRTPGGEPYWDPTHMVVTGYRNFEDRFK